MATIRLCGFARPINSGPSPKVFRAYTKMEKWPSSHGEHEILVLYIGDDTVEIWPVPDELRPLLERVET